MTNGRLLGRWLPLVLLGIIGASCANPDQVVVDQEEADSSQRLRRTLIGGNILQDAQQDVQVKLPSGAWKPAPPDTLNDSAELYAFNPKADLYFLVLGEKEASTRLYDLDSNAAEYRKILSASLDGTPTEKRGEVSQFNGYPAVQYEINGLIGETPVTYLHTTVQVNDMYYQVVAWTNADNFPAHREEMQSLITSFRKI